MFPGDKIRFLTDILRKQIDLIRRLESKANFAIGFSAGVLTFTLNFSLQKGMQAGVIIVLISSMLAVLSSLFALKPPKIFSKKGQKESLFYHTAIARHNPEKYIEQLQKTTMQENKVIEQYGLEIYNLAKYSIYYKKLFAHLSIQILVVGLILGTLVTVLQWV